MLDLGTSARALVILDNPSQAIELTLGRPITSKHASILINFGSQLAVKSLGCQAVQPNLSQLFILNYI